MNAVRPAGVLGPTRPSSQAQRPAFDYGAVLLQCLLVPLFPLYVHVVGGGQSIWHAHLDWRKQRSRTKSSSLSVDFVTRPRSQCQEERQKRHNYYRGPVALSKPAVRKRYAATVSHALSGISTTTESHSVDKLWTCYTSALDTAAWEVLGPRRQAKQSWISQATLSIIEQRRKAVLAGDVEEYKRLAGSRRRALRHDKQQWAERIALEGEQCLCSGEIKDAFTKFRQLRPKSTVLSTPLKAADGCLLSDRVSVVSWWKEHFCNLLNRPLHDPPDVLVAEAEAATPDADIDTHPRLSWRLTGLRGGSKQEKLPVHVAYTRSTSVTEVTRLCRHQMSSSSRCGNRKLSQTSGAKGS